MKKGKWDDSSDEEDRVDIKKQKKSTVTQSVHVESISSLTVDTNKNQSLSLQNLTTNAVNVNISDIALSNSIITADDIIPGENYINQEEIVIEEKSQNQQQQQQNSTFFHGCRSVDEYQRISFINQGTYGLVYKARCLKTKDFVALKEIKMTADSRKVGFPITALREINILLALRHPNIIQVREMVVGSTLDKIYMVMDYYENDLKSCMDMAKQSFSTSEVKQLMIQLLTGVDHMHSKWYIHRDLKTSNILYSNTGLLCICDFGLARKYGSPIAPYTNEVVTLWYRPPELLLGGKSQIYSTPLDVWSVGCIFAELLTGKPLFPGQGEADQINLIFRAVGMPNELIWPGVTSLPQFSAVSWRGASSRGKLREMFPSASFSGGVFLNETGFDLLSRMLHMDPKQRITASEALAHAWLTAEEPRPSARDCMPQFKKQQQQQQGLEK